MRRGREGERCVFVGGREVGKGAQVVRGLGGVERGGQCGEKLVEDMVGGAGEVLVEGVLRSGARGEDERRAWGEGRPVVVVLGDGLAFDDGDTRRVLDGFDDSAI